MERADHRVRTVALDFGRKPLREEPNEEPAEGRRDRYEPQSVGADELGASLARQRWRAIAGKAHEKKRDGSSQHQREKLRRRGSDDSEQKGVENESPLAAAGRCREVTSQSLD